MEELIKSSIIRGFIFSAYDKLGPQPIYMFPKAIDKKQKEKGDLKENTLNLTFRDYTQISIKNLSLLIGDGSIFEKIDLDKFQYFGIIPFPDFSLTSLTFFHFINVQFSDKPLATSFSILIDEPKRSFMYNNINRLKNIIIDFFDDFDNKINENFKTQEEVEPFFKELLQKIINIEKTPLTPITTHRKLKILFAGLDNSGKTSFLLSVDRKFSKLIGLKPTSGAQVSSIEALGATIFLWDLGGQLSLRRRYLSRSEIYLYEADLLFYFIDVRNRDRFEESIQYFQNIKKVLKEFEQKTPIIYILSKGDPDILDSKEIKENVKLLTNELTKINSNISPEIYTTSIFQIFTILRSFSSGISKLSPNRDLITHNLKDFSSRTETYLTLLLSNDGLVLAEYFTPEAMKLTEMPKSEELINVFEITAPQFAMLFKIFSKYKAIEKNEAIFKVSNSVILFKRIYVVNYVMYILFLIDNESKKENINNNLPDFLKRTQDLLIRYIS